MYTITGYRETFGNRGLVSFSFSTDADSPEDAVRKCGEAFGSYDVTSGDAILVPAQFADVQVTSDNPDQIQPYLEIPPVVSSEDVGPVPSPDAAIAPDVEPEVESQPPAVSVEPASDSNG